MLYSLIQPYKSLCIIGMCKNAGKTTVLNCLIDGCFTHGSRIGLTSAGRDGESSDLVTNTKKPEIFVYSDTLIATSEAAMKLGSISREILGTTGMNTPMGEVILMRAMCDGFVQLAGPSMTSQLTRIRDMLLSHGAQRVFIDGALSRKSLAMPAVSDAAILCSGASYSADMTKVVCDTACSARLFSLTLPDTPLPPLPEGKLIVIRDGGAEVCADMIGVTEEIKRGGVAAVVLRGGVTETSARILLGAGRLLGGIELIAQDASRLLISSNSIEKLMLCGARLAVMHSMKLIAVTVNPFSAYGRHFIKGAFFEAMNRAIEPFALPVIDVLEEDADA